MSLKNKLLFMSVKKLLQGKSPRRYFVKILVGVGVIGLLFTITVFAIVGFSLNQVSNFINKEPTVELIALEGLIAENELVLSEEQKTAVIPLLRDLVTKEGLTSQEAGKIEDQVLNMLTPSQLEALTLRQDELLQDASQLNLTSLQAAFEGIAKYTGVSVEGVQQVFNGLQAWWEVKDPTDKAPQNLLEQIEGSK